MTNLRVGTAFDAHQIQPGKECWIAGILHEGQDLSLIHISEPTRPY